MKVGGEAKQFHTKCLKNRHMFNLICDSRLTFIRIFWHTRDQENESLLLVFYRYASYPQILGSLNVKRIHSLF